MLPITWLTDNQSSDATGLIRKALEIADQNQRASEQKTENLQLVQQNVQMNFQVNPPEASSLSEQKLQLEWQAMQLNQQKNNLKP